jgi:hypothetical protein
MSIVLLIALAVCAFTTLTCLVLNCAQTPAGESLLRPLSEQRESA